MCVIPAPVTALYLVAVINLTALLNLTLVSASVIILNEHNDTIGRPIEDLAAMFGPPIPYRGVWGHVIGAEPQSACEAIRPPPVPPTTNSTGWIAVIERGGCAFDIKVLEAQKQGYIAVIVYNIHSDELIPMHAGGNQSQVRIPSVFIAASDGEYLIAKYSNNTHYLVNVDQEEAPSINEGLAMVIFVVFGTIIAVSFLTLIVIGVVKWVREIRRRRRSRLSRQHLNKIPVTKFKKGDPYDVCAICLDEYEEGHKLRVLPCNHAYHQTCIDPWLTKKKKTCPICKQKVIPGRNHDSDSSADSAASDGDDEGSRATGGRGGGRAGTRDQEDSDSENTPLLRGATANTTGRSRGRSYLGRAGPSSNRQQRGRRSNDSFAGSGIPEEFRPTSQYQVRTDVSGLEDSDNTSSVSGESAAPMGSLYQCENSVEVHSEPDFTTRVRPPRRRGGLNTRYTRLEDEPGTARHPESCTRHSPVGGTRPYTAPPLRPRSTETAQQLAPEYRLHGAYSLTSSTGSGGVQRRGSPGAVALGGAVGSDVIIVDETDDVAPCRDVVYVSPGTLSDALDDHIESNMTLTDDPASSSQITAPSRLLADKRRGNTEQAGVHSTKHKGSSHGGPKSEKDRANREARESPDGATGTEHGRSGFESRSGFEPRDSDSSPMESSGLPTVGTSIPAKSAHVPYAGAAALVESADAPVESADTPEQVEVVNPSGRSKSKKNKKKRRNDENA